MRSVMITTVTVVAAACGASEEPAAVAVAVTTPALVLLADASAAQLGRDVDAAEQRGLWLDVKHKWSSQPVKWTVYRNPALCRSAAACNVAAFPIRAQGHGAMHGWLPRLEWNPGQYDAMVARCGATETCELAIEGRIGELEVSPEQPTRVTLGDVRLASVRLAQR